MDAISTDSLAAVIAAALRASHREPLPTSEVVQRYLAWQCARKTKKSFATDVGYLRHFLDTVRVEDLRAVTTTMVADYLQDRAAAGKSPKTVNRSREVLHTLFQWLVETERLDRNPVTRVRRVAEPAPTIRYLTHDQVAQLLRVVDDDVYLRSAVATLIFAGLRRGELVWLRREDVDLERRLIVVRAKVGEWEPKTKRNRVVPVASRLMPYLRAQPQCGEWFFASPQGCRWHGDNLHHRFRRVVRAAGLTCTLLDLRHTFGTQLVMKGVSLAQVSALMGNSPEICRRHYAHVATEILHDAVEW